MFSNRQGCWCERCTGRFNAQCPECKRTDCAKAYSHGMMCNQSALNKHKTIRRKAQTNG